MTKKEITLCYFGIYEPVAPRDRVYLEGLQKRGMSVLTCVDNARGFQKFFNLVRKHRALRGRYDILWVGYLSTMVVPLAWLITKKKIVFNALDSWYDRSVCDRGEHTPFSLTALLIWLTDFLAFHLSTVVLVESEQQKLFIAKRFLVNPKKLEVVFTGVDEAIFHPDPSIKKAGTFTVVFRGMFLPATGVEYVIEAARLLKDEDINFRIIGWGEPLQSKLQKMISEYGLTKVTLTTIFLSPDELRATMLSAHVMLGQFSSHPRMGRTIQNKTIEALALGMPYITRDSPSNRELLTDGYDCLFVAGANPRMIAEKILLLKRSPELLLSLSVSARETFELKCNKDVIIKKIAL
ncbi:MAG: glycosyltransferase [Candidatus Taylorbacteria bacterium]|nr:glycosyltransferase [Candidatus Taylorbacteria bacterium]